MISEQAYQKLRGMIYQGRLKPGERLVERDLAGQLGISRIPLREGLARLEYEGLVRTVPRSATYVEDFKPADVLEIYAMRELIEPMAARLAAMHGGQVLVDELKKHASQMENTKPSDQSQKLDRIDGAFHRAIVQASNNSRLIRAYEVSNIQVLTIRSEWNHSLDTTMQRTFKEHNQMIECISRGDAVKVQQIAYEHVHHARKGVERFLGV